MLIQFSPIRSGSTLVYNILIGLGKTPTKKHHISSGSKKVVTVRHPYNSIVSSMMRYNLEINTKNLISQINEYVSNGGIDVLKTDHSCCVLLYEEFYKNFDYIFDKFEVFFF